MRVFIKLTQRIEYELSEFNFRFNFLCLSCPVVHMNYSQ
jgi:hypothetical protein